jgi:hypothetical protein
MHHRFWLRSLALATILAACDEQSPVSEAASSVALELQLPALRASDGTYRIWVIDAAGSAHAVNASVAPTVTFASPIPDPAALEITVEPAVARPNAPRQVLLRGTFRRGTAALAVEGALTRAGLKLRERPGQFTMFTPSDNLVHGYPSYEESGIWLFNMEPRSTEQNDMWVRLTPLTPGWLYEGWMVRDYGSAGAIWLSYGKFLPDAAGAVNTRDDTGWGPFSGVLDFQTVGEEEFPGDDWISNPLSFSWPAELRLPLDLREKTATGAARWTHVITIEPITDRGEPIRAEQPFPLVLYRDPFGDGAPGKARAITFHATAVPTGSARLQ